jgi:hypothetical protein
MLFLNKNVMSEILSQEQIEMLFGERLDSSIFTWDNYCGTMGYSLIDIYDRHFNDNSMAVINDKYECRGWCYASQLTVRNRAYGIAIMLWEKNNREQTWCHCSDDMLDMVLDLWMEVNKVDKNGKLIL